MLTSAKTTKPAKEYPKKCFSSVCRRSRMTSLTRYALPQRRGQGLERSLRCGVDLGVGGLERTARAVPEMLERPDPHMVP